VTSLLAARPSALIAVGDGSATGGGWMTGAAWIRPTGVPAGNGASMAEVDGVVGATRLGASGIRLSTSAGAGSAIADSSTIEKPG